MLLTLIRLELLKTKRSLALLMMLVSPLMVLLVNILLLLNASEERLSKLDWSMFWLQNYSMWGYFMMPLYIALITALLNGIEHKANGWRFIFALPICKSEVFLAKYILASLYLAGASVVLFLATFITVVCLSMLGFDGGAVFYPIMLNKLVFAMISGSAILAIQHSVSWRWKNIVVPLGLGVIATMSIMQFASSKFWPINPWTYTLVATNSSDQVASHYALLYSVLVALSVLLLAMLWSRRSEVDC